MRIILALTALIFLSSFNPVFAQEASFSASISATIQPTGNDIGVSKITPASSFYFLKTIRETLEMKFAGTSRVRMFRQLEFATRRLRETKSLIPDHEDLIPPTLERYWSHLSSLPQKDIKDQEIETRIKQGLIVHLEVLEQIYNKVTNKFAKMAIRSTINRMSQREDLSFMGKIRACNFLQKEATSSALEEVEREILWERAQNCLLPLKTSL